MAQLGEKCIRVEDFTVSLAIMALLRGIKDKYFKKSFSKSWPKTMADLQLWIEKYINLEET